MPPTLIVQGKKQILGQTFNSVVYAVAADSKTGYAKNSPSVLKGGTVWYEGREAQGPGKDTDETDVKLRKEAALYEVLGKHDHILNHLGLEEAILNDVDTSSKAWALRLEHPPAMPTRLSLAVQFTQGVTHIHASNIIWGDLSTRNALLFPNWRLKLCDFVDSDFTSQYPSDWYGCEVRYCPPGSDRPHRRGGGEVGAMKRELFALGTAICEITEWRVPYGSEIEVDKDGVIEMLVRGELPRISGDNPARDVIRQCWRGGYGRSQEVVDALRALL